MLKARDLRLRPKSFTRPTERFEPADLDRWGGQLRRLAAAPSANTGEARQAAVT